MRKLSTFSRLTCTRWNLAWRRAQMENAAYHQLELILKRIDCIRTLTEGGNPFMTIAIHKAKCKYLEQELTTNIQPKIETSLMPTVAGDKVGSVLRHIAFAVANVERLVSRSCERKWWNEIFWMGDGSEAFGEVLLDLQAAMDIAIGNGSRCRSELGQAWNSMVLQDRSILMCNVRLMVEQRADLATGRILDKKDLELAKHVMRRDHPDNVIQLGMVRVVKRIVKGITCIRWHGKECVMKSFLGDEFAKAEAAIMKDLMHPHVVLLIGYAHRKNRLNPFSQPSSNILLEYAEQGDLRDYIQTLRKDVEPDVIVNVMLEIAKGMHYIHSKKIAHLDLKSMNVYVTYHTIRDLRAANFFHVKIGDFGTAIRCDHDRPIPDWVYGQGTPSWRAPELFKEASRRSDLDLFKADVYSYAMVCVELVTRELPLQYRFPELQATSSKVYEYISVANNRPPLPDTYPPQLLSIIRHCWDGEPLKRPSFENIVEALETLKKEMLVNDQFYTALPKQVEVGFIPDTDGYYPSALYTGVEVEESAFHLVLPSRKRKVRDLDDREAILALGEDDELATIQSPLFDIRTIHPLFNAHGCKMLIQLGEDVRRKIHDFVDGGAMIGQHMYTSRAAHLQPILGEFQAQLHASNLNNSTLFNEVFNILKKVEFLLGSCSWPAIEFHGGPTPTDEAFLSVRKNLHHCVQMMKCSSTLRITFEEVSKFQLENPDEETWSRACDSDRNKLLQFLSYSFPWGWNPIRHRYLGNIAIISKFNMPPDSFWIPFTVDEILWDEGPDGLIMGPIPFLPSQTYYYCEDGSGIYHQRPISLAVKVSTRKLAYDFIKLASLQHPHVVQMFGAWEYMGSGYVAMKMMQTNVMQFLSKKQEESLSVVLLLTILVQVAEGMAYMHSHHVRHHNLKCSNVLVGGFYKSLELVHVEVSDYGFERRQRNRDSKSNIVQFGEGDETDEYAFDVYQFALLCSKLFSIRGSDVASTASAMLDDEASVVSFPVKCPRDLALYLHKCGSKEPNDRPKFAEICTVLRNHKAYMILSGDQPASHDADSL